MLCMFEIDWFQDQEQRSSNKLCKDLAKQRKPCVLSTTRKTPNFKMAMKEEPTLVYLIQAKIQEAQLWM